MVIENKDAVVAELKDRMRQAIDECPNMDKEMKEVMAGLDKVADRKSKLIDMHVDGLIKSSDFEKFFGRYDKQEQALMKRLSVLDSEKKIAQDLQQKLDNVETAIENLAGLKEFGDSICGELLHKVVVASREKISFYLTTDKNAEMFVKLPLSLTQLKQPK
jgi:hypothetical protein